MSKIPVSVCIIAKNEEKYIEECLKKLQPYGFEIIVTDTGSTDRTKEIAEKYGVKIIDVLTGFKYIGEKIGELEAKTESGEFIQILVFTLPVSKS